MNRLAEEKLGRMYFKHLNIEVFVYSYSERFIITKKKLNTKSWNYFNINKDFCILSDKLQNFYHILQITIFILKLITNILQMTNQLSKNL